MSGRLRVLHQPRFDTFFETLCGALYLLGHHTGEALARPVYAPVRSLSGMQREAAEAEREDVPTVGIVPAPQSRPRGDVPRAFGGTLEALQTKAPALALVVVSRDSECPGTLGEHQTWFPAGYRTSDALALSLKSMVAGTYVRDFMRVLPEKLPCALKLILGRGLEDLEAGVVREADELVESACHRSADRLEAALEASGTDRFGTWWESARIYAYFRSREDPSLAALPAAAEAFGFSDLEEFNEAVFRQTGSPLTGCSEDGAVWREILRLMAVRWCLARPIRRERRLNPGSEDDARPSAFLALRDRYEPLALRVAREKLSDAAAREVVEEVFAAIFRLGPSRWPTVEEGYVVRATRNRMKNRLRAMSRQPTSVDVDGVPMASTGESPDKALLREERDGRLRAALHELPPRWAVAWSLCDRLGWPPRETAELLGCTTKALALLRGRAKSRLRTLLHHEDFRP